MPILCIFFCISCAFWSMKSIYECSRTGYFISCALSAGQAKTGKELYTAVP